MRSLSREQVRRVDRLAIDELGIPGVVLMENAGRNAAAVVLDSLRARVGENRAAAHVAILCGGGNNGGDGYVIARHLHNAGVAVEIYAAKDPAGLTGDAAVHAHIIRQMGLPVCLMLSEAAVDEVAGAWSQADGIVDALLGTGFSGTVRQPVRRAIERCNATRHGGGAAPVVVAIDVPSGMDCDTGRPAESGGLVIRADVTVTFVAAKGGFAVSEAKSLLGRVVVADIGVPPELVTRAMGLGS